MDPAQAGWRYLSFETLRLGDRQPLEPLTGPADEALVVVIGGGGLDLDLDGRRRQLVGRSGPFDGLPTAVYLPPAAAGRLVGRASAGSAAVEVAIGRAPVGAAAGQSGRARGRAGVPIIIEPADVEVEIRGAGNATRQINHIVKPDFPAARLLAVEVLTPSGNWSSWPPHKHDVDAMPAEAVLEELYHYRFRDPRAWGVQRLYRRADSRIGGPRDALWAVRDRDTVLVPDGYHPFVATHGYDAWYLNVLAGDRRTMACTDDPDLVWVRDRWPTMAPDPRVPLYPLATEAEAGAAGGAEAGAEASRRRSRARR
ncbi:MAG TPA: 5-deoxy-glucuronate isomerase [Candidatus Limnocylindrales bacterium]|nr:5-deoxy-glucuronate isomerase [Candidatus Limnocylindrales bacterium]